MKEKLSDDENEVKRKLRLVSTFERKSFSKSNVFSCKQFPSGIFWELRCLKSQSDVFDVYQNILLQNNFLNESVELSQFRFHHQTTRGGSDIYKSQSEFN